MFSIDEHVEVEATWGIYQRMIAAYRHPRPSRGPRADGQAVRVAERQGQLMVEMVQTALREVDLSPEQASALKAALARQARELMGS